MWGGKVTRIVRQLSPVYSTIGHEKLENVEYIKYMGSMMTKDARCIRQITSKDCRSKSSVQEEEEGK